MKLIKHFIKNTLLIITALLLLSIVNYYSYNLITENQIFSTPNSFDNYHHILILGAGKKNPIFYTRMNAAIEVFNHSKIYSITCSGLTGVVNYNEPYDMRDYLLLNGISDSIIKIDSKGNRTINSIENYAANPLNDSVIIVSQQQHLQRALFIANCKGLSAVGYAAYDFNGAYNKEWFVKEFLSRIKCTFDLIF